MGQIDFNTFKQNLQNNSNRNTNTNDQPRGKYVGYFSLKNDKDQAVVRIMVDSPEQLKIMAIHRVTVGGRLRAVNCMRNPSDPVDTCPFCAADKRLEYRVYIPIIEYTRDDQGKIVPRARMWERSALYADTITNLINNYGPLSDNIFKIVRNGEAGSKNTTYDIVYGLPSVYKAELYPKDESLFEGFELLGTHVVDATPEEAAQILSGVTPERLAPRQNNNQQQGQRYAASAAPAPTATPSYQATPTYTPTPNVEPAPQPVTPPVTGFEKPNPMATTGEAVARPRRFYQ